MAFISNCPKCQKPVLVPDVACPDAVVQCPMCSDEYSLGELLAAAPPALIVVHPGSAAVAVSSLGESAPPAAAAVSAAAPLLESGEGGIFSAYRIEPSLHEGEPLLFEGDEVQLATPDDGHGESLGYEVVEHAAEPALFEPSTEAAPESDPFAEHPIEPLAEHFGEGLAAPLPDEGHDLSAEPFGEALAAPLSDEGHDLSAEPSDGSAPWGGAWGGFKDEAAEGEDGAVGMAEADQDEGLEHVNFADITGKAAPGSGFAAVDGGVAVDVEPPKKKKRKREANVIVRLFGMAVAGLLALVCVIGIASWRGVKMDFLPAWLQFNFNKPTVSSLQKTTGPASPPANAQAPAANPPAPANAVAAQAAGKQPDQAAGETKPAATPNQPAPSDASKGDAGKNNVSPATELAMNDPSKEATKPAVPANAKTDNEPSPFDDTTTTTKPAVGSQAKPDVPAADKPAKPDDDAFAPPPAVSPVNEKSKAPADSEVKPPVAMPAKPDVPATEKTETPATPDADPFGPGPAPAVSPVNEKGKTPAKPPVALPAKPDLPATEKTETPAMPDADPFGSVPAVAPVNEKPKPDAKADVAPVKPEVPAKPEKPAVGGNPAKTPELKPDAEPVIGPEPKPEAKSDVKANKPKVKPDAEPPVKPDVKLAVKPAKGVGPLQAPSFPAAELAASLKSVDSAATVDAKSYADWCQLAEVVTYVQDGADSQKQALRALTEKVAASPQAASAIAASAKKRFDDKATKGGIVLAGTVTAMATKNGLSGTVIRMEGMAKPVMVFSAHALDVKENQKVIVFGALVAEPVKNLPGYTGKQPVVVWTDFATAIQ